MSLHPHVIAPVPDETARVARAAFPKGHPYMTAERGRVILSDAWTILACYKSREIERSG